MSKNCKLSFLGCDYFLSPGIAFPCLPPRGNAIRFHIKVRKSPSFLQAEEQKLTVCTRPTQFTNGHKGLYTGKHGFLHEGQAVNARPRLKKRKDS